MWRSSLLQLSCFTIVAMLSTVAISYAAPIENSSILETARQIAVDSNIAPLDSASARVVYQDSAGVAVSLRAKNTSSVTSTSEVTYNAGALLTFAPKTGELKTFDAQYQVHIPSKEVVSNDALEKTAISFAKKHFPSFWMITNEIESEENDSKSFRRFSYIKKYRGLTLGRVEVGVRVSDGKVTQASSYAEPAVGDLLENVSITPEEAKEKFFLHIEEHGEGEFEEIKITNLSLLPFGKPANLSYLARIQAVRRSDKAVVKATNVLDAVTGKFSTNRIGFANVREQRSSDASTSDTFPIWSSQGLSFLSQRQMEGPDWANFGSQLVTNFSKLLNYLTYDLAASPSFVSAGFTSSWITMQRQEWAFAFDTIGGSYRVLGTPERPAMTPTVSPDGSWAIVAATGRTGNAGFDLFADQIAARGPELQLRARLVLPGSDEHHPIYSPDGKWLYFVSTKQEQGKVVHALRRIPATVAQAEKLTQLKPEQIETVVASLPADVQRMSVFPDGKQLVLQTAVGIFTVAVEQKKVTPIKLPPLKDTEVGGALIQEIGDAWAGPSKNEVTFSGKTIDADKKERRRIYSCRFDGSNLKALTPAENKPVPAYKFPQGEKTTYELAKEMALGEIKWEDAHRER